MEFRPDPDPVRCYRCGYRCWERPNRMDKTVEQWCSNETCGLAFRLYRGRYQEKEWPVGEWTDKQHPELGGHDAPVARG